MVRTQILFPQNRDVSSHNPHQHHSVHPSSCDKTRKGNKRCKLRKEEIKLSLFTDDTIVYVDNLKDSKETEQRFLGLVSDDSELAEYQGNIKSIAFPRNSSEQL